VLDGAQGVTLWITDGLDESKLELTPDQVRSGALDYRPVNVDVNFRMQVGPFTESLRIIRNEQQIAAVTTPSKPATVAPIALPSVLETVPAVKPERKSKRLKQPTQQPAHPVAETPVRDQPVERSREVEAPPPPQLALGPTRFDRPPIPNRAPELPKVTATVENPRVSPLKKAFGWMRIPGTNRKDFTPPKAVKQVQPHVYAKKATSVAVQVAIDDHGYVWDADLLTKDIDSELGLSAVEAAKRWRFEPARVEDKPVGSNMVVRFHFGSD
jgi:periplasmic protein TonB